MTLLATAYSQLECGHLDKNRPIDYLTYEAMDNRSLRKSIQSRLIEGVVALGKEYPEIQVAKLVSDIQQSYNETVSMHMTLAYLGGLTANQRMQGEFSSEEQKEEYRQLFDNFIYSEIMEI